MVFESVFLCFAVDWMQARAVNNFGLGIRAFD